MFGPGTNDPYWEDNDEYSDPYYNCGDPVCVSGDTYGTATTDTGMIYTAQAELGYYPSYSLRRLGVSVNGRVHGYDEFNQPPDSEFIDAALQHLIDNDTTPISYFDTYGRISTTPGRTIYSGISGNGVLRQASDCSDTDHPLTQPTYIGSNQWTAGVMFYKIQTEFVYCPDYECPPNMHYENGTCVPDEGWVWCDDSHTSVCPHCYTLGCLEATGGSANPSCYDIGATFQVCIQWIPYDPNCHPTSEMDYFDVPITYEGSLANSISGPDVLTIDIQNNSTGCITLTVDSSIAGGGTLSIIPAGLPLCSPNQTGIILELCTVNITVTIPSNTGGGGESGGEDDNINGIIDCDGGGEDGGGGGETPGGGGGIGPNGEVYGPEDCCSYMPKDYLVWKEGIGLAETIPPYMKSFFINNG